MMSGSDTRHYAEYRTHVEETKSKSGFAKDSHFIN